MQCCKDPVNPHVLVHNVPCQSFPKMQQKIIKAKQMYIALAYIRLLYAFTMLAGAQYIEKDENTKCVTTTTTQRATSPSLIYYVYFLFAQPTHIYLF